VFVILRLRFKFLKFMEVFMAYNSGYWETLEDELRKEIAEAQAEIERLTQARDMWRKDYEALQSEQGKAMISYVVRESEYKKQIEQMREALRLADDLIDEYAAVCEHADNVDELRDEIKAALSAAERGE